MTESDQRLAIVIITMAGVSALSMGFHVWPTAYALYLYGGEFILLLMDAVAGTQCVVHTTCAHCTAFVSLQHLFFLPRLIVLGIQEAFAQLVACGLAYLVATLLSLRILHDEFSAINRTEPIIAPRPTVVSRTTHPIITIHDTPDNDDTDACVICLEHMTCDGVLALPCAHLFHEECIRLWMHHEQRCPVCNYDLHTETTV